MSTHSTTLHWQRKDASFGYKDYPREHRIDFKEGHSLACTAAAEFLGDPALPDPEQTFAAALSGCHMLTFLAVCSLKKLTLDSYQDEAVGFLEKGEEGRPVLARIELHPQTVFAEGVEVSAETLAELHHKAHEGCFLANSVKTEITTVL